MKSELDLIPRRIKELREILDISVEEIAKKINVEVDVYNQLESGEKDIPISLLYEIADVLNVDCTVLMTGQSPRMNSYAVCKNGEGVAVDRYEGYHFESIAFNFKNRTMEPMIVTLNEDDEEPAKVVHGGQEFNFVLEGSVKVTVGAKSFILNKGDCIYFDPSIPHGQAAVGGSTKFLTVINE